MYTWGVEQAGMLVKQRWSACTPGVLRQRQSTFVNSGIFSPLDSDSAQDLGME